MYSRLLHTVNVHHNNDNREQQVVAYMHNIWQKLSLGSQPRLHKRICSSNNNYSETAVVIYASSFRHYNSHTWASFANAALRENITRSEIKTKNPSAGENNFLQVAISGNRWQ
jgi:hypothetical protein